MKLPDIDTIAVLGAGTMGHGIAELATLAEYDVHLQDISEELVHEGYEQLEWSLQKLEESGTLEESEGDAAAARVMTFTDAASAVADVDVVIEVVPEDMDLKQEVFANIDEAAPADAVFASNTSTMSITELSEATDRSAQVCGMHFFNPPVRMQLVEVISGEHTADETLNLVEGLAAEFGKTSIRVHKDAPGFVVNRILVPMLNEAAWLVESGDGTVAEVDSTAKYDLELPMGTFELLDQIGIDVVVDVIEYMQETLGAGYEPCPLLIEKVEAGEHGKKTGQGFYDYEDDGANVPTDTGSDAIAARLVGVAVNEAAKLVANDVSTPEDIDEAVMLGAGFPSGPTELAAAVGDDRVVETLERLAEKTSEARYEVSPLLAKWADEGGPNSTVAGSTPDFETIRLEYPVDNVAQVVLNRPNDLNSVNYTLLAELDEAIDHVEAADARVLLITGAGDTAFCGGADLQFMGDGLAPFEAVEFSRVGQRVFSHLAELPMPVIAGVDGFCLGGGMELAACVDLCVASRHSEFGQPELDLGILPGWGGTQRLQRIVGERRAREIILTANRYDAVTMREYGFVNEVVDDGDLDDRALELAVSLARGPPLAQEATKNAMLAGRHDMKAGLRAESDAFGLLWTTGDTVEGVDAFKNGREPSFKGE